VQAQLRAPLREGHPRLLAEQPGEGALPGKVIAAIGLAAATPLLLAYLAVAANPVAFLLLIPAGITLYIPFSIMVSLGQLYLPGRVGMASGVTLGLAASAGGITAPLLG
jgi:MFS transporter, FSR family, fosmidomycin resistance protein